MAKAKRGKKNPPADGDRRAVYVDSSLNTHMLLHVYHSDTVSALRKKLVHEHLKCFPDFGKIKIHALKVKRSGCFYHLAESMPVSCAFEGFGKFWLLSVDASWSEGQSSFQSLGLAPITNGKGFVLHPTIDLADPGKACIKNQRNSGFSVEPCHLQEVTENDQALAICNDSNETALGPKLVPDENPLCQLPQKIDPQKVPASTGIDTNGIACATANEKVNTSEGGVKNGSRKRKRPTKQQSRGQGIHASPAFHKSSNTVMHCSEDKNLSNDKNKRRILSTGHDISSQDAADRKISKVMVIDFKNSTCDEGPKEKSVAVNPNLSSMEDEICKGKIAIDESHKVVLLENFNPSHQNDINGHVKEGTSLAELIGSNKGNESKKSNNGKKLKKPTKGFVEVQSDALAMDNKTHEKIEAPNEKDHKIMLSEEVGAELHIRNVVDVKVLGQIEMVNDNLPSESFLPDHTDKTYEKEELQREDDPDRQNIELVGSAELINTSYVRESVKSNELVPVATAIEKNVNPCSDVSAPDHTSKSDERRELPNDDEAMMLSERGDDLSRMEGESFLVLEAPEQNHKDSENLKKEKVKGMQIPMEKTSSYVSLKEPSPIDCIANDGGRKDEKMAKKMKESKVRNVKRTLDLSLEEQQGIDSKELNPQSDTLLVQEEASNTKSEPENQLAGSVVLEDTNSTTAGLSPKLPDKVINSNLNKVNEVTTSSRSNHGPEVAKGKKRSSLGFSSSGIQCHGPSSEVEHKSISESHKRHQINWVPEEAGWTDSNGLEMRKSPAPASLKKNTESSNKNRKVDVDVSKASINKIGENKKSLFGRSGTIFEVDSSESSKETEYSNTESLSDSSSSSSSSSESSDARNLRSNECFGSKGKEHKNVARTPGTEKLSLEMVLKRSSRFQKARLAIIECQRKEEAESQVAAIVPDSEDIVPDSDED